MDNFLTESKVGQEVMGVKAETGLTTQEAALVVASKYEKRTRVFGSIAIVVGGVFGNAFGTGLAGNFALFSREPEAVLGTIIGAGLLGAIVCLNTKHRASVARNIAKMNSGGY